MSPKNSLGDNEDLHHPPLEINISLQKAAHTNTAKIKTLQHRRYLYVANVAIEYITQEDNQGNFPSGFT